MNNIGSLALIAFSAMFSWMLCSSLSLKKLLFFLALISVGLALTFILEKYQVTGTAKVYLILGAASASLGFVFLIVL